jgi:hypothetical protein
MKLKLARSWNDKAKKGDAFEIVNIMRSPGLCASGVQVLVVGMFKKPTWMDLGWFVPPVDFQKTRTIGRK